MTSDSGLYIEREKFSLIVHMNFDIAGGFCVQNKKITSVTFVHFTRIILT